MWHIIKWRGRGGLPTKKTLAWFFRVGKDFFGHFDANWIIALLVKTISIQETMFLGFRDILTFEHDFIKNVLWTKTHHSHGGKRVLVELGPIEVMWLNWGW